MNEQMDVVHKRKAISTKHN